ncbi:hypothetical protein Micbo1qcDRAFT_164234, partial [Microdochium bolleyi]
MKRALPRMHKTERRIQCLYSEPRTVGPCPKASPPLSTQPTSFSSRSPMRLLRISYGGAWTLA